MEVKLCSLQTEQCLIVLIKGDFNWSGNVQHCLHFFPVALCWTHEHVWLVFGQYARAAGSLRRRLCEEPIRTNQTLHLIKWPTCEKHTSWMQLVTDGRMPSSMIATIMNLMVMHLFFMSWASTGGLEFHIFLLCPLCLDADKLIKVILLVS